VRAVFEAVEGDLTPDFNLGSQQSEQRWAVVDRVLSVPVRNDLQDDAANPACGECVELGSNLRLERRRHVVQ
jgi:hypothetical protein